MGYIEHHSIIVCGNKEDVEKAHKKAKKIFDKEFEPEIADHVGSNLVSEIILSPVNYYHTFFIAPDGSKVGWDTSEYGDKAREKFKRWVKSKSDLYVDMVEVEFGGDSNKADITDYKV